MRLGMRLMPLLLVCSASSYALPDLQVTQANHFASGCLTRGETYHGSGVIKNVGDVVAQNFRVLVRMYGVDSYFDVASLAPNMEQTFEVDRLLPADAPCQRYGIRVVVDVDATVAEASEGEDNAKNGIPYFPCECPGAEPTATPTVENSATATPTNTEVSPSETPTSTHTSVPTETPTVTNTVVIAPSATHTPTSTRTPTATVTNTPVVVDPSATPTRTHTSVPPTATPTRTHLNPCNCISIASATYTVVGGEVKFFVHIANSCDEAGILVAEQEFCLVWEEWGEVIATLPEHTSVPANGSVILEGSITRYAFPPSGECVSVHLCFCDIACIAPLELEVCLESTLPTPTQTATVTNTPVVEEPSATPTQTQTSVPPTATPTEEVLPDLSCIEAVVDPSTPCLVRGQFNQPITTVHIRNSGGTAAGPFTVSFIYLGWPTERQVAGLGIGEASEITLIPPPFLPDCDTVYGITVTVDSGQEVSESDEDNNVFAEPLFFGCCEVSPTPTETPEEPTETATATATATETEVPSSTATPTATEIAPTPTATAEPVGCDSGYYILDSFGGLHRAGSPPLITGSSYFGADTARDLERASVNGEEDLVVLDKYGVNHFVAHPDDSIPQDFYFIDDLRFPQGRAVDIAISKDSMGMWVLTDYGRIYRAGSVKNSTAQSEIIIPAIDGMLGWDIPTPNMHPLLPPSSLRKASLRAVSLVVIDATGDSQAEGYIIFDSQGGRYQVHPDGSLVAPGTYHNLPENHPLHLLDPSAYYYPFFGGLDILRDAELHPSGEGLVVFDGWGGIHPVPVDQLSNPVFYTRNEDPENPGTMITTVGMPYITVGFDDPQTLFDESIGIDSGSIYVDLEFSPGCPDSGFWTLDKFGAVFVFGSLRSNPDDIGSPFHGGPYFFPHLFAEKMVPFPQ